MTVPGYLTNDEIDRLERSHPEIRDRKCPTCAGEKVFRWSGEQHECLCDEQKRLRLRYLHAGIGDTYQRLSWGDLGVPTEQLKPVIEYLDDAEAYIRAGMGLLLWGPVGTGKTMLLNLVLKELVKSHWDTYYTTFAGAVENFTATWGDNDEKKNFHRRFISSRLLGLDDLGKEYRSASGLSITTFDHILRTRVQHGRPTLLTTNMNPVEMRAGYGAGTLSLLVEKSVEVPLMGVDFRPRSHERTLAEIKAKEVRPIV